MAEVQVGVVTVFKVEEVAERTKDFFRSDNFSHFMAAGSVVGVGAVDSQDVVLLIHDEITDGVDDLFNTTFDHNTILTDGSKEGTELFGVTIEEKS